VFTIDDFKEHPGNIFFVDSGHSAASDTDGFGKNPDAPFATIDYAIGKCTASQGDVVYVLPGHAETVSGAAGINLDVIGIRVIGLGDGSLQPTIDLTDDAATVAVAAANVTIENLKFTASSADVASCLDVNADYFTARNCFFLEDTTNEAFTICVLGTTTTGSEYITVEGCRFMCPDAAASSGVQILGGAGHRIIGNEFYGDWSAGAIDLDNTPTYTLIADNLIYNADDTADNCINADATATGICVRNLVANADTQANQVTATAMTIAENYGGVIAEDLSGLLDPIAT
jgi:hypothetical protein